jgi:hypothetical protein
MHFNTLCPKFFCPGSLLFQTFFKPFQIVPTLKQTLMGGQYGKAHDEIGRTTIICANSSLVACYLCL